MGTAGQLPFHHEEILHVHHDQRRRLCLDGLVDMQTAGAGDHPINDVLGNVDLVHLGFPWRIC
jgi:hypothetical protein